MNHPILLSALADDRRRRCSCGSVTQKPYGMCRGCQAGAVLRHETARSRRLSTPRWPQARVMKIRLFKWVALLLQIIGKGAES